MTDMILRALLLLLLVPSLASGQSGAIPSTYFGLHDNFAASSGDGPFPLVSFGATRFWDLNNVTWPEIETSNGVYNWTALDNWVNSLSSHGVTDILWTFGYTPLWATNNLGPVVSGQAQFGSCYPPLVGGNTANYDSATFKAFVSALATRYKGKIRHYEMWNEPGGSYWCGTQSQIIAVYNDIYSTVKAIDPTIQVHLGVVGLSGGGNDCSNGGGGQYSLNALVTALGNNSKIDAIDAHLYPYPQPGTYPEVGNLYMVNNLLCGMSQLGISGKPIWDTEDSWDGGTDTVAYTARQYLYLWSRGISRSYLYSYDLTNYGSLSNSPFTSLTATGIAYQQVYNWMVGSTMTTPCAIHSGTVWTCGLTSASGNQKLAVWNTAGSSSFTVPSQYIQYADLAGKTTPVSGSSVTIGIRPILLESTAGSTTPNPPTGLAATVQ